MKPDYTIIKIGIIEIDVLWILIFIFGLAIGILIGDVL